MAAAPPNPAQPPVPNVAPLEPRTLCQISPPMLTRSEITPLPHQAFARRPQIPIAQARLDRAATPSRSAVSSPGGFQTPAVRQATSL
jgi:hypothetical protein